MSFPLLVLGSSAIVFATVAGAGLLSHRSILAAWAAALLGATGLLFFHGLAYLGTVPDDAYISFHYAQHLADGIGPNWNSTGRVEGYTNFSLVALTAALHKVGFDILISSQVLGCLGAVGTFAALGGIWGLWRADEPDEGLGHPSALAAVLLLLGLSSGVAYYTFSGLETSLFMGLLTASAYLHLRERRGRGTAGSAVALAALGMTRPEGAVAAIVTGAFKLAGVWQAQDRIRALRPVAVWTVVFLALYGSFFLWRYTYYDHLFPNTFYAKTGTTMAAFNRGIGYLRENGLRYQVLLAFVFAAPLLARARLRPDVAYIMVLSAALLAAIVYEGGDFMPYGRFIVPLLPLLYLAGASGFAMLLKRATGRPIQAALLAASVLSLSGLSLLQQDTTTMGDHFLYTTSRAIADWFHDNTPPNYRIGAVAVGSLSYYSNRDIIDMVGLNDTVIAHTDVPNYGNTTQAHEKYNTAYVLDVARPEIIIGPTTYAPVRRQNIQLTLVNALNKLYAEPRFWDKYQLRPLYLSGQWYNLFVRNDVADALHGPGLAQQQNLLVNPDSPGSWQPSQSSLQASVDGGVGVSSTSTAYGVAQETTAIPRVSGRRYLALAWVRGTASSAGSLITISLGESDASNSDDKKLYQLTADWQAMWIIHTAYAQGVTPLRISLSAGARTPQTDGFTVQDAQVVLLEN